MDVSINGAKILFSIPAGPLGQINISQTLVMSWIVLIVVSALCIWLGNGLKVKAISRKQAVAEMAVSSLDNFVHGNMGRNFDRYIPLVGAIFVTSVFSNLISLLGFWSPTADLCTEAAWAVVVFLIITYHKIKASGILGYLKGYLSPIFIMAPINVISEVATPVSMACRHFGNILSGMVINSLIYASLGAASYALLGLLNRNIFAALLLLALGLFLLWQWRAAPAAGKKFGMAKKILCVLFLVLGAFGLLLRVLPLLGNLPVLAIGLPAVLSLYFDWFSGCIQAFIFCTLTTIFIKQASGEE